MILFLLAYFGGILTIVSPCILPVLPFVFARSDQPFIRSGLPMLFGMALTFALVASLVAVGGSWAVHANQYGRIAAMVLLALFGLTLIFESLADRLTRPIVALGNRLSQKTGGQGNSIGTSLLLGIATGLLWAPCAGPVLGIILTGAAINGASVNTTLLLFSYALGAATALALALLIGGRVFTAMKRSLGAGEWIRKGLGVLVLAGVVAIAFGLDTGLLAQISLGRTSALEQALIDRSSLKRTTTTTAVPGSNLPVEGQMPSLAGATQWLNSPPLTPAQLRGKVVLIDFWTYSCINCLRSIPYVEAWAEKYKDHGLVVIGVHSPEFAFEFDTGNVQKAIKDLGISYPVALDNNFKIWQAFDNQGWPAHYFIDAEGRIRYHHLFEGEYDQSEKVIQTLLIEAGNKDVPTGLVNPNAKGAEAVSDLSKTRSPETYLGFMRQSGFADGSTAVDVAKDYTLPTTFKRDNWGLSGNWFVTDESIYLNKAGGAIAYRFHARDVHLVMGQSGKAKTIRFRVTIDGKPPGDLHGVDTDAGGNGVVDGQRLYQLVRGTGYDSEHTFQIEFLDAGVEAFSFTFG